MHIPLSRDPHNMKIRKAVFPVAGLGTRVLPATKAMPKEMLTIVDRPLIQYVVDEAKEAGIEHFIFVTGRNKGVIEDHFDRMFELDATLEARGKKAEQAVLEQLTHRLRELNFSLSLQRFGGRFSMIGNLARLGLAYLKIDGSYIRDIDQESDKRLFIEAIQRAAHSIDLPLIAERVETEGELQVIREMGIFGVQGQLFGEPAPWR